MKLPVRPTVRGRLALLLAALAVFTGIVLLVTSYLLVRANFDATVNGTSGTPHSINISNPNGPGTSRSNLLPHAFVSSVHTSIQKGLARLLPQYAVVLGVLIVVGAGLAWIMAGRILRPLRTITTAAQRIGRDHLDERLMLSGPDDELKQLADTFDSMLSRLETAFQDQQLFAANAAHQLRTPLAVMRAELDLALTGPNSTAAEQHELASRLRKTVLGCEELIERLMNLTRSALVPEERETVSLDHIASQQLAGAQPQIAERGLTVRPDLDTALVEGEPRLLAELVDNLIGNAIKHNHPQGWITVTTRSDGHQVVLEVANSGPNLVRHDLDRLVEPFRQANQQRVGDNNGLGLSIVRTIVAAHQGTLTLEALPDGGLRVRAAVPAASTAPNPHPAPAVAP